MTSCKVCGKPLKTIEGAGRPPKYCEECADYYNKENIRRKNRERVGNPKQDIEILRFLRKKKD